MGTRHLVCVVADKEFKVAQYGQWDGYPSGQGLTVLDFLNTLEDKESFKKKVQGCKFQTAEENIAKWMECGLEDPKSEMVSMAVSDAFGKKYPYLSRDCGAEILKYVNESKNGLSLKNNISFAADSLFCEWAYVIDLDMNAFEVYQGFNQTKLAPGERFEYLNEGTEISKDYYPVKLVATFSLDQLPTEENFVNFFNQLDDEDIDDELIENTQTEFKPTFNFYELMQGVFLLEVENNNDLGNTFLRAQEFYESVNPDMQGKAFTLAQYQEWYKTQSETGEFTYGEDWRGFNLPSSAIEKCYNVNQERLPQDIFFLEICRMCKEKATSLGLENYYLLGVRKGDTETLDHEIAHGLYTVNPKYKQDMNECIKTLPDDIKSYLYDCLTNIGYASSVHDDEIQAFLSTGISDEMDANKLTEFEFLFKNVFKKYVGEFKLPTPLIENIKNIKHKI